MSPVARSTIAKSAKIRGGPVLAPTPGMASQRHLSFLLASLVCLACTARENENDATTSVGEGGGSSSTGGEEDEPTTTGTDGEDPSATTGGSDESGSSGGSTSSGTSGEECEGPGCFIPCQELDAPPPGLADCYDQGPGECGDATIPPNCAEDGHWVCPDGWDFGGYGEGCTFPGDE